MPSISPLRFLFKAFHGIPLQDPPPKLLEVNWRSFTLGIFSLLVNIQYLHLLVLPYHHWKMCVVVFPGDCSCKGPGPWIRMFSSPSGRAWGTGPCSDFHGRLRTAPKNREVAVQVNVLALLRRAGAASYEAESEPLAQQARTRSEAAPAGNLWMVARSIWVPLFGDVNGKAKRKPPFWGSHERKPPMDSQVAMAFFSHLCWLLDGTVHGKKEQRAIQAWQTEVFSGFPVEPQKGATTKRMKRVDRRNPAPPKNLRKP